MKRDHGRLADTWWLGAVPPTGPTGTATTWVGVTVEFTVNGRLAGLARYDNTVSDGNTVGWVFDFDANINMRAVMFRPRASTAGNAWHQVWFRPWLRIILGHRYYIGCIYPGGNFFRFNTRLATPPRTVNNIAYWSSWQSTAVYPFGSAITTNTNANAIDVLFYPDL